MPRRQPYEHLTQPLSQSASGEEVPIQELPIEDGGIEIVVEDDGYQPEPVEQPQQRQPEPAPEPEPQVQPQLSADDDAYNRLRAQLEREQNRGKDLESRLGQEQATRTQAEERARQAEIDHLAAHALAIDNALEVETQKAERAATEAAKLFEDGDFQGAMKAQRTLIEAENNVARLRDGKTEIEARRKQPATSEPRQQQAPVQPQRQEPTQDERVEAYINQKDHSPRVRDYFRRNYDDIFKRGDAEAKTTKLIAAHWDAVSSGHPQDSEAYFRHIDQRMGYAKPEPQPAPAPQQPAPQQRNNGGQVQQAPRRAPMPPSAPVSRDSGPMNGGRQTVKLTADEVALCRDMGVDPKAYAVNKVKIAQGGRDPNYSGPRFTGDQ